MTITERSQRAARRRHNLAIIVTASYERDAIDLATDELVETLRGIPDAGLAYAVEEAAIFSTYGRCDTCGEICTETGCSFDSTHAVAVAS